MAETVVSRSRSDLIGALLAAFDSDPTVATPEIVWDCSRDEPIDPDLINRCPPRHDLYEQRRQIMNRRFQFFPAAIVLCTSTEQVSVAVRFAKAENLTLRVRSGGHDHEGESTGNDCLLLDLSGLNRVTVEPDTGQAGRLARIEPGIPFRDLTTELANHDVMIPHGTCDSVCIGGFSMGGGWGPWTRKHGMCCEHIVAATMVLGDGSIITARIDGTEAERQLLWAIKGGGGFSYGIVTELVIRTFDLPWEMFRFSITWNPDARFPSDPVKVGASSTMVPETPTMGILKAWEQAIGQIDTESANQLVGTNLKIYAKPRKLGEAFDAETICHGCVMYGYWEGDRESLLPFIEAIAAAAKTPAGGFIPHIGEAAGRRYKGVENHQYAGSSLMNEWHQETHEEQSRLSEKVKSLGLKTPFQPDHETPEAHKITSRLVDPCGLDDAGRALLLESLTSPLLDDENLGCSLYSYVTLGAITGSFYQRIISPEQKEQSAFPYKDHLYTIQYQTWWGLGVDEQPLDPGGKMVTSRRLNRALDWMQECRDAVIPNTSGAFISFKDGSIPTSRYFDKNYASLIRIKQVYSCDSQNLFSSRKTII